MTDTTNQPPAGGFVADIVERTPAEEAGRAAATKFNANNPGHFPGRPLFEGLVAGAFRDGEARGRAAALAAFRALLDATIRDAINTGAREVQQLCRELKAGAERAVGG